jgi:hypothetical protein
MMKLHGILGLGAVLLVGSSVFAADSPRTVAPGMEADPIFSDVVVHPVPEHFKLAHVENTDGRYLEQLTREGEDEKNWSQMITVSGSQGLAKSPVSTPKRYAAALVQAYTDRCAGPLRVRDRGDITVGGHDAHAVLIGCELASKVGEPFSESTLFVIIRGDTDFYTVQWAERDAPPPRDMGLDGTKWNDRLAALMPTRVCSASAGAACRAAVD